MPASVLLPTQPQLLVARNTPFINRDLSWLQFNERVLAEARLASNPLLERIKFLAITASNLDEFFMIRLASIQRGIQNAHRRDPQREAYLVRIRDHLMSGIAAFGRKQADTLDTISHALGPYQVTLVRRSKPNDSTYALGKKIFSEQILPHLSAPENFSVHQLSNLENLQMAVISDFSLWIKIPKNLPGLYISHQNQKTHAFFLDDLLMTHMAQALQIRPSLTILRLTRDGDIRLDIEKEDSESIPDAIQSGLKVRDRGRPVRLQYLGSIPEKWSQRFSHHLKLLPTQIQPAPHSLCLNNLWSLYNHSNIANPDLRYSKFKPYLTTSFKDPPSVFERLKQRDILLHHPYDSFDNFVTFIQAACSDASVEAIYLTVYRVDTLSKVIDAIKKVAKKKKIRVMIELRARFDELNNLRLADELRSAGVEVGFGFGKLKLHAKVALISRKEADGIRYYTHLSTGNYNATTAQAYTDLAILTANQEIGVDAKHFFDRLIDQQTPTNFKQLVSAPNRLHRLLLNLISQEVEAARRGQKARIVAKVNALVDEAVVGSLYEASQAGVEIDLIVRGACSLIPHVKGLSERIRVISLVDKYLEHSRIYYFGHSKALYLSSADWMPRNFFSRLEIAFPILDPRIYHYIENTIIPTYLQDNVKARELGAEGNWKKRSKSSGPEKKLFRAQEHFETLSTERYVNTSLSLRSKLEPAVTS